MYENISQFQLVQNEFFYESNQNDQSALCQEKRRNSIFFKQDNQCCEQRYNDVAISLNFCQNLRELFITGCKQITDSFFDYLTESNEDAEQTFSLQQNLEVLKIGGLVKLTSRALDKISIFVALKILEIANINKLSYEAIAKIVQSCPKFTVLDLRSIKSLKSEEIQQLSQLNQNLKILTTKITQESEDPENDQISMKKPKSRIKSRKRKKSSKGKKKKKQF